MLSFSGPAILLVLAIVFVRRRFYRDFPFFFVYILFAASADPLRQAVRNMPGLYFWTYWVTEAFLGVSALLALNEVFKHLFEYDYEKRWWFRLSLPTAALVAALVFLIQPVGQVTKYPIRNAVFSFDLGMHCLEILILLLFLLLERVFTAAYDQHDYGIVKGFGVSAGVTILADVARSHFGSGYTVVFSYAPPVGYIIATLIWLHAFLRKPQPRQKLPITLRELLELLKKEAEIVARILRNWKVWRYQGPL